MQEVSRRADSPLTRWRVVVRGTVQGVGFRPFVHRLAERIGVAGGVQNAGGNVLVEAEGTRPQLDRLVEALRAEAPPLARVEAIETEVLPPRGESGFAIAGSEGGAPVAAIPPDIATCDACMAEVLDPADRRYRYPFTNCTNCGPRFSLVTALPYDRANTTMSGFAMCPRCRAEYADPRDRRFHAQPNACPVCGPALSFVDPAGRRLAERDPALLAAADAIRAGAIVGVKGLGGFHLVADATSERVVHELRRRKGRPAKPLALMAADAQRAAALVDLDPVGAEALASVRAPVVLAPRAASAGVARAVAPGLAELGVMRAYTPLHRLLLDAVGGPVVATSGNRSEEPICIDEAEALERLRGIADRFLVHDRPIARPVDDSVVRVIAGRPRLLRAARGYAPVTISLPEGQSADGVLAVGGHLKTTLALGVRGHAVLGSHVGDLETPEAIAAHERAAADLCAFFATEPRRVACDAHPDYCSTRFAEASGKPVTRVQHHVAHVLACMAEHGLDRRHPVLGVSWDGTGYGADGTIWGGELFRLRDGRAERVATLRPFRLPGGEKAVREPWRCAAALVHELGRAAELDAPGLDALASAAGPRDRRLVRRMLEGGVNSPLTSSVGRLFDGAAALLGIASESRFEGEAAMRLEAAAAGEPQPAHGYPFVLTDEWPWGLDWRAALEALIADRTRGASAGRCAARLHQGLAAAIADAAERSGDADVVLSGGCFQNRLLVESAAAALGAAGRRVWLPDEIPANDGGLALGQLYAAAMTDPREEKGACACA